MCCVKPSFQFSLRIQAIGHNFFSLLRGEKKSDSNNFWKRQFRNLRRQTSNKYRQKRKELLIGTITRNHLEPWQPNERYFFCTLSQHLGSWGVLKSPGCPFDLFRAGSRIYPVHFCPLCPTAKTKSQKRQMTVMRESCKWQGQRDLSRMMSPQGKKGWKRSNNLGESH